MPWRKYSDVWRALVLQRRLHDPVLRWSPEQLKDYQQQSWRRIAQQATTRAPF